MSANQKLWDDAELEILRRPITAEQMRELMPYRSNQAIRLKRNKLAKAEGFTPVNPAPDYAALARLGAATRRITEAERKSQFIMAINAGTPPTHNGIVTRSAYQRWREKDPEFLAWLEGFKREKKETRDSIRADARAQIRAERQHQRQRKAAALQRATIARKTPVGESHRRALLQNDVYRIAVKAIGPGRNLESAVSAMVLDLLEGIISPTEAPKVAGKYRAASRQEISYKHAEEVHDTMASYNAWMSDNDA